MINVKISFGNYHFRAGKFYDLKKMIQGEQISMNNLAVSKTPLVIKLKYSDISHLTAHIDTFVLYFLALSYHYLFIIKFLII